MWMRSNRCLRRRLRERGYRDGLRPATTGLAQGPHRRRFWHTDGRVAASLLAPGGPGRGCLRRATKDPCAGRGPCPVSRWRGPRRARVPALRASWRIALLRQNGSAGHPLLLPRVAFRRAGSLRGAAVRAGGWPAARQGPPTLVPGRGALWPGVRLHGATGQQAPPPSL